MIEGFQALIGYIIAQSYENSVYLPFVFILAIVGALLARGHWSSKQPNFDFYEVFMHRGRISLTEIARVIVYLSVTWWFISMCAKGTAGATEAAAYAGVMLLDKGSQRFMQAKDRGNNNANTN